MRRAAAASSLVLTGSLFVFADSAAAQEGIFVNFQKRLDTRVSSVSTTTTLASGAVTETTTHSFDPSLTLNIDSLIYPNLRLNTGGVFEVNKAYSDTLFPAGGIGTQTDSTITRIRPFFLLRSINPVLSPGVGFFRREDRARTTGFTGTKLVNDDYAAYLGWKPEGGPQSDFQFVRTNTFDGNRAFEDTTKDVGSLVSSYNYKNLSAYYNGASLDSTDRLRGLETEQVSNAARVGYSGSFIDKRLFWNAMYNVNDLDIKTRTSGGGGGEIDVPLIPNAGLATLSDTPVTAALLSNPLLIDGNLTAGVGLNLGLPAPGTNAQARNIGLDLLNRTEINRLLVWVDRELPFEVAASFSWEVYSSPDNLSWNRETLVSAVPFGPFENRFEVNFPSITVRYVKVVTRPLSAVVPDAARFPDILVTEVQPFLRRPAGSAGDRLTQTIHTINTDVRMRLVDSLYYEGFYLYNGPDRFGRKRDTLSNGVSVNHAFGPMFSVYGRGAFENGTEPEGHRSATVTNATLTASPIPTFRSSLLYSGQDEQIGETPRDRRVVYLQNTAQLYRGVDLLFGFGWNFTTRETGEISHDRLTNVTATVAPRQHVNLTLSYDDTTSERSGTFVGPPRFQTRRVYATVAVDPIRTLHLVFGEDVVAVTGEKTRVTHNIDVNWAPFPDGALQFVFVYDEALRDLEFGQERNIVGAVRWNLSRRSYIDVSYQRTKSEFVLQAIESNVLSSDVRLYF